MRCDWCGARLGVLLRFVARRAGAERGWLRLVHGLAELGVLFCCFFFEVDLWIILIL